MINPKKSNSLSGSILKEETEKDIKMKRTIRLSSPWPKELGKEPEGRKPESRIEIEVRGPRESFIRFLTMSNEDAGKLLKRHFFSHRHIDNALRPKPRGQVPDRAFNYALHSIYEWAKSIQGEARSRGLYERICDHPRGYDIFYPAEIACYVAGELFKKKVPLAASTDDEGKAKQSRDFIRNHRHRFGPEEKPLLIMYGESLVKRLLKIK